MLNRRAFPTIFVLKHLDELSAQAGSGNSVKIEEIQKYMNRLIVAKKRAEKRIVDLGGTFQPESFPVTPLETFPFIHTGGNNSSLSLGSDLEQTPKVPADEHRTVLNLLLIEPGIGYFREFMDTQPGGPVLLQFYFTVTAIQNSFIQRAIPSSDDGYVCYAFNSYFFSISSTYF
jgi:hypothetical protein